MSVVHPIHSSAPTASPASMEPTRHLRLLDGSSVLVRRIGPADRDLERRFIETLSPESRRRRFLGAIKPDEALLTQLTEVDPEQGEASIALVAEGAVKREVGVARWCLDADGRRAECALVVADDWIGRGLGTQLMRLLIGSARARGLVELYSLDAADNDAMRSLAERFGFRREGVADDPVLVVHRLELKSSS